MVEVPKVLKKGGPVDCAAIWDRLRGNLGIVKVNQTVVGRPTPRAAPQKLQRAAPAEKPKSDVNLLRVVFPGNWGSEGGKDDGRGIGVFAGDSRSRSAA